MMVGSQQLLLTWRRKMWMATQRNLLLHHPQGQPENVYLANGRNEIQKAHIYDAILAVLLETQKSNQAGFEMLATAMNRHALFSLRPMYGFGEGALQQMLEEVKQMEGMLELLIGVPLMRSPCHLLNQ
jgi:hypothetical protein